MPRTLTWSTDNTIEKPRMALPQRICAAQTTMFCAIHQLGYRDASTPRLVVLAPVPLTISVLRRLVPLKHSRKDDPAVSAFSRAVVWRMYASVASISVSSVPLLFLRATSELRASSSLPRRTEFQGDSGAK
jgi:hypothetical protein